MRDRRTHPHAWRQRPRHAPMKVCGPKSKWGTNACVGSRETMRRECRLLFTTSFPKRGLPLQNQWRILSGGKSERKFMPGQVLVKDGGEWKIAALANCRCEGRRVRSGTTMKNSIQVYSRHRSEGPPG